MQVDTVVIMRVAISKTTDINSHMKVKINGKVYGISRVYHNYNKNETELSLFEGG